MAKKSAVDLFEDGAKSSSVTNDKALKDAMKKIAALVDEVELANERVRQAEGMLKDASKIRERLLRQDIPDFMEECGLSKIETEEGRKVEVKEELKASIKKDNQEEAYAWLRDNDYGDIIKDEVIVKFGAGDEKLKKKLVKTLMEHGYTFETRGSIHWQTLRAFCKEQIELGNDLFDLELFGVFQYKEAKIK